MASNGKGLLGKIAGAIAAELSDDETPEKDAPKTLKSGSPVAAPAPVMSGTVPYNFGQPPAAAPADAAADDQSLQMVASQVFVPIDGRPSRYLLFKKMYETLGSPPDPNMAVKALQVGDSSLTGPTILADIVAHLKILETVGQTADTELKSAAEERLGGADSQIKNLNDLNELAASEIARHQRETNERIGQIAQLSQGRAEDEAKIARANARADAAEATVRSELQRMQTLFANIA